MPSTAPEAADGSFSFVDVNGDNLVSPVDVLMVVNLMNTQSSVAVASAVGESLPVPVTPPAAATLRSWTAPTTLRSAAAVDEVFSQDAALKQAEEWDELLGVLTSS